MIQEVVGRNTQLQPLAFADLKVLLQGQIVRIVPRAFQVGEDVTSQLSLSSRRKTINVSVLLISQILTRITGQDGLYRSGGRA